MEEEKGSGVRGGGGGGEGCLEDLKSVQHSWRATCREGEGKEGGNTCVKEEGRKRDMRKERRKTGKIRKRVRASDSRLHYSHGVL